MKKNDRLFAIKKLILNNDIATQQELMDYLKNEGFQTTQATLSRDIKELNLIKVTQTDRTTKYTFYHDAYQEKHLCYRLEKALHQYARSVTAVQFLVTILVTPNYPNVIASLIDELKMPSIVGTIASFDTCLIILHNENDARLLCDSFSSIIHKQAVLNLEKEVSFLFPK